SSVDAGVVKKRDATLVAATGETGTDRSRGDRYGRIAIGRTVSADLGGTQRDPIRLDHRRRWTGGKQLCPGARRCRFTRRGDRPAPLPESEALRRLDQRAGVGRARALAPRVPRRG